MVFVAYATNTGLVFVAFATKIIRMAKRTLSEVQLAAWKSLLNAHATSVGAIEAQLSAADEIPLI